MNNNSKIITILIYIVGLLSGICLTLFIAGAIEKLEPKGKIKEIESPGQKSTEKIENVRIENYNNTDYYIITGDYKGDYDYQSKSFTDSNEPNEIKEYNMKRIMNYNDYSSYCNKWNLKKVYDDTNKNYMIIAYVDFDASVAKARIATINKDSNKIKIYLWEGLSHYGADITGYFIAIPIEKNITKNEIFMTITETEFKNIKEHYSYGRSGLSEDKPIIYIYPKEDKEVTVKLSNPEKLLTSYPKYNKEWKIKASSDGTLIDENNKSYYGLYWEGKDKFATLKEDGFVIEGKESERFLKEKLTILGLNEKEINEFLIYWLPKLINNKYNYIRFETEEEINNYMGLEIIPKPDTLIRVVMDYKPLDNKIKIKEQKLVSKSRKGYIVVEWGGTEIK